MALGSYYCKSNFTLKGKAFLFPDKATSKSPLVLNRPSRSYGELEVTATVFCNYSISPTLESGHAL